jgi:hypothetical protein
VIDSRTTGQADDGSPPAVHVVPEFYEEESSLRGTTISAVSFCRVIGKKCGLFSGEAPELLKEKPGRMARASQSNEAEEVRPHAHFVAKNRHISGDGQDETDDP